MYLSVYRSIYVSIYHSIYLCSYLSIYPSIHPSINASIHLSIIYLSIHPSIHQSIHHSTRSDLFYTPPFLPIDRPERGRPNADRWRFVVFVCMAPARWSSPQDLYQKRHAYQHLRMTTHWPVSYYIVSP